MHPVRATAGSSDRHFMSRIRGDAATRREVTRVIHDHAALHARPLLFEREFKSARPIAFASYSAVCRLSGPCALTGSSLVALPRPLSQGAFVVPSEDYSRAPPCYAAIFGEGRQSGDQP